MNSKVKIILAVVLLVLGIGAIVYYLSTSRSDVNPDFLPSDEGPNAPVLPDDVLNQPN